MARYPNQSRSAGRCSACGKVNFVSRREAKVAAKQYPDARLNVYKCGDYWHLGTLPGVVKRGVKTRSELADRQEFLQDMREQRAKGAWSSVRCGGCGEQVSSADLDVMFPDGFLRCSRCRGRGGRA